MQSLLRELTEFKPRRDTPHLSGRRFNLKRLVQEATAVRPDSRLSMGGFLDNLVTHGRLVREYVWEICSSVVDEALESDDSETVGEAVELVRAALGRGLSPGVSRALSLARCGRCAPDKTGPAVREQRCSASDSTGRALLEVGNLIAEGISSPDGATEPDGHMTIGSAKQWLELSKRALDCCRGLVDRKECGLGSDSSGPDDLHGRFRAHWEAWVEASIGPNCATIVSAHPGPPGLQQVAPPQSLPEGIMHFMATFSCTSC
jgi:hypothetical protein